MNLWINLRTGLWIAQMISQIELKCDPTRRRDAKKYRPEQLNWKLSGKQNGPAVVGSNCYSGPNH